MWFCLRTTGCFQFVTVWPTGFCLIVAVWASFVLAWLLCETVVLFGLCFAAFIVLQFGQLVTGFFWERCRFCFRTVCTGLGFCNCKFYILQAFDVVQFGQEVWLDSRFVVFGLQFGTAGLVVELVYSLQFGKLATCAVLQWFCSFSFGGLHSFVVTGFL